MQKDEIRRIFMPYCLKRLPDGRHVVLNRNYKPLGFMSRDYVDYADYAVKFIRLTKATASKLSYKSSNDIEDIHFYNDGCVPTRSAAHMKAYLARLAILAKLRFEVPEKQH